MISTRVAAVLLITGASVCAQTAASVRSARAKAIQETIAELEAQCLRSAGGDWQRWFDSLASHRADLAQRASQHLTDRRTFRSLTTPPVFAEALDLFGAVNGDFQTFATNPLLTFAPDVSAWFRQQGIEVIFAPIPKMDEVYPEAFSTLVPPDGIVYPQSRLSILKLLRQDVETLNLLPIFQRERGDNPATLYLSADPHWSDKAMTLTAREVGARLKRYPWVRAALARKPEYQVKYGVPGELGEGKNRLTAVPIMTKEEIAELDALPTPGYTVITTNDGKPFTLTPNAPILVIGDSYTFCSRDIAPGSGINALIARETNLPVNNMASGGATSEIVKELLRSPEKLAGVKVVVWCVSSLLLHNHWRDKTFQLPIEPTAKSSGAAPRRAPDQAAKP